MREMLDVQLIDVYRATSWQLQSETWKPLPVRVEKEG